MMRKALQRNFFFTSAGRGKLLEVEGSLV